MSGMLRHTRHGSPTTRTHELPQLVGFLLRTAATGADGADSSNSLMPVRADLLRRLVHMNVTLREGNGDSLHVKLQLYGFGQVE